MKDERGFTLIEVLASLVIISIVLMSFMSIFANTNALAVSNSEKLVVINLADAYLERVKVVPKDYVDMSSNTKCNFTEKPAFFYSINKKDYEIKVRATQDPSECILSLVNIEVEVTAVKSNISSKVEGYVADVKESK